MRRDLIGILAAATLLYWPEGAFPQAFQPIAVPATPIHGPGFTLVSPASEGWMLAIDRRSGAVALAKSGQDYGKRRGSIVVIAVRVKARMGDLDTLERLQAELERNIRASSSRQTLVSLALEPDPNAEQGSDCIRISSTSEERNNPVRADGVLLLSISGKACLHPSSRDHYVQITYSERRPLDDPPLMDAALQRECQVIVDSLRLVPAP